MAICSSNCPTILPPKPLGNSCTPDTRPGGISHVIFASCDVKFTDIYDKTEWCRYIAQGKIVASLEVLGKKDKASAIKKKTTSCRPEMVTGFDYTVTFQDYNADDLGFKDYDFWNEIQLRYQQYQVAFLTCDGLLLGFDPSTRSFINTFAIEVSNVIEDDFNGSSYWDGAVMYKGKTESKPVLISNLAGLLSGTDCSDITDPYSGTSRTFRIGACDYVVQQGWGIMAFDITAAAAGPGAKLTLYKGSATPNAANTIISTTIDPTVLASTVANYYNAMNGVMAWVHCAINTQVVVAIDINVLGSFGYTDMTDISNGCASVLDGVTANGVGGVNVNPVQTWTCNV